MSTVSERALFQRLQRYLSHENIILCKSRENSKFQGWINKVGRYFTVTQDNTVKDTHINLEQFGRDTKCLKPWESLAE